MKMILTVALALLSCMAAQAQNADIVVLGEPARIALVNTCGPTCKIGKTLVGTVPANSSASDIATYAKAAKHVILVVDAKTGATPVIMEHIQIARQAGVPSLSIFFVNVASMSGRRDANERMKLEEDEVRDTLSLYELDGERALVFHDAEFRPVFQLHTDGIGFASALGKTIDTYPRQPLRGKPVTAARLVTQVYLLSEMEAEQTAPLAEKSTVTLWLNGVLIKDAAITKGALAPGGHGELVLTLPAAVTTIPGSRFFIERNKKLIAMGVVSAGG